MENERGKLFVVEGGVGCGKSTQLRLLSDEIRSSEPGRVWHVYREPGSTEFGELMRHAVQDRRPDGQDFPVHPYASLFAYSAARANLIRLRVIPDLEQGINVGLDRFWYSTYGYQGADGVSKPVIFALSLIATRGLKPDVVLHYDLDPVIGQARKMKLNEDVDRFDAKALAYHQVVRKNYHELKLLFPGIWEVIDASQPIEKVKERSLSVLRKHGVIYG